MAATAASGPAPWPPTKTCPRCSSPAPPSSTSHRPAASRSSCRWPLSRTQFAGFRTGSWGSLNRTTVTVAFTGAWDLHQVKPSFFPVPGCVLIGHRDSTATKLAGTTELWAGRLPAGATTEAALGKIIRTVAAGPVGAAGESSPYATTFSNGATLYPRLLVLVEDAASSPLGAGAGRRAVRSKRDNNEKKPWKSLRSLTGTVERQLLRPTLVGDSVLPFRLRPAATAVVPWDGTSLERTTSDRLDLDDGLTA